MWTMSSCGRAPSSNSSGSRGRPRWTDYPASSDVKMEDANASEVDYGSTADTMEQASDVESEAGSESSKKRRVASGLPKEFYPRDPESAERPWFDLTDPEAKWYKARYVIDLSPNNEEYADFVLKYGYISSGMGISPGSALPRG